jgi:alpha-tubulin suppressor-like RCC1 family protein
MAVALGACSLNVDYTGTLFACDTSGACPAHYVCQDMRCIPTEPPPAACAIAVGAGDGHSCAIRKDGQAWCWGNNDFGQLGDGSTTDQIVPVAVAGTGLPKFKAIAGGDEHTCALGVDGSVWCWGHNNAGQLGNGSMTDFHTPVAVSNLSGATAIAVGAAHTCAIRADLSVVCWGHNDDGQIGNGAFNDQSAPSPIDSLHGVTAIAAGGDATCAVDGNHQLWCWGDNQHGQLGDGTKTARPMPTPAAFHDAASTAVGDGFSCALSSPSSGSKVTCFGLNDDGQLGATVDPDTEHLMGVPVEFAGVAVSIVARTNFACLTDDHKQVWCWGENENFQLADRTSDDRFLPVLTDYDDATAVAAGGAHTCALSTSGGITCSGYNGHGQLGNNRRTSQGTPHLVSGVQNAVSVTAGEFHTCATLKDGTVTCWGGNGDGDLGDGTWTSRGRPGPVTALTGVKMLASGFGHSCALSGGAVLCWGSNDRGQLGDLTTYSRGYPVAVPNLGTVDQVAAGGNTSCARIGGAVSCWGQGGTGQLGNGDTSDSDGAVGVKMLMPGVRSIAVGDAHVCAVNGDASVACWGFNGGGELGNGNKMSSDLPVAVMNLGGADQITAGDGFTCAHTVADAVWCWGFGFNGEIGIDDFEPFTTPQRLTSLTGTMKLVAGGSHACVIKASGALSCWGASYSGEIGDGGYNNRGTPVVVPMPGGASVLDVSAGEEHTCVVLADSSVACWGDDRFGQLGDGILADQAPVAPLLPCP